MGTPPTLHYFHGAADPWSHLTAQLLPALAAAYPLRIVPHLVPAPSEAAWRMKGSNWFGGRETSV